MRRPALLATSTFVLALAAAWTTTAFADDRSEGVPLPALRTQPPRALDVRSSAIALAGRQVTVELVARGAPARAARLAWTSAPVAWMGDGEPYPTRQFPELAITVDGSAAADAPADVRAGGRDVGALVAAAGLDPWTITDTPPFVEKPAAPGPAQAFAQLVDLGAIAPSADGALATWTARRHVVASVGAGADHRLRVAYDARPGYALRTPTQLAAASTSARYCLSDDARRQLERGAPVALEEFEIPAGLDERRPPAVTLVVAPASGRWFACGADGRGRVLDGSDAAPVSVRVDTRGVLRVLRLPPKAD